MNSRITSVRRSRPIWRSSFVATAMVFHTDGAADPRENTVDAIAGQVSAQAPAEGSPEWREVEIVEIPAGRAVRLRGVEYADPDDSEF